MLQILEIASYDEETDMVTFDLENVTDEEANLIIEQGIIYLLLKHTTGLQDDAEIMNRLLASKDE
jgi:hypothetical protein